MNFGKGLPITVLSPSSSPYFITPSPLRSRNFIVPTCELIFLGDLLKSAWSTYTPSCTSPQNCPMRPPTLVMVRPGNPTEVYNRSLNPDNANTLLSLKAILKLEIG